jgi:hypothetical protein
MIRAVRERTLLFSSTEITGLIGKSPGAINVGVVTIMIHDRLQ